MVIDVSDDTVQICDVRVDYGTHPILSFAPPSIMWSLDFGIVQ